MLASVTSPVPFTAVSNACTARVRVGSDLRSRSGSGSGSCSGSGLTDHRGLFGLHKDTFAGAHITLLGPHFDLG